MNRAIKKRIQQVIIKKISPVLIAVLILSGCTATNTVTDDTQTNSAERHLEFGYKLLSKRDTKRAIVEFDKAISLCENTHSDKGQRVYAARGLNDTIYYMALAAVDKKDAIAVAPTCADALYLRGYAGLDLGQLELAEQYVQRAVDMSPVNSMYISELGHIYHQKRDWQAALDMFKRSESAAETYSPDELKTNELGRAKRGVGFSLIELGNLDAAEKKFKECLLINADDKSARNELEYIKQARADKQ